MALEQNLTSSVFLLGRRTRCYRFWLPTYALFLTGRNRVSQHRCLVDDQDIALVMCPNGRVTDCACVVTPAAGPLGGGAAARPLLPSSRSSPSLASLAAPSGLRRSATRLRVDQHRWETVSPPGRRLRSSDGPRASQVICMMGRCVRPGVLVSRVQGQSEEGALCSFALCSGSNDHMARGWCSHSIQTIFIPSPVAVILMFITKTRCV